MPELTDFLIFSDPYVSDCLPPMQVDRVTAYDVRYDPVERRWVRMRRADSVPALPGERPDRLATLVLPSRPYHIDLVSGMQAALYWSDGWAMYLLRTVDRFCLPGAISFVAELTDGTNPIAAPPAERIIDGRTHPALLADDRVWSYTVDAETFAQFGAALAYVGVSRFDPVRQEIVFTCANDLVQDSPVLARAALERLGAR